MFLYFVDFLHALSITEHPDKRTVTEVRFNKRIKQQATFTWVYSGLSSEQSIQFLICSFTYTRDLITKIKIIVYGEP